MAKTVNEAALAGLFQHALAECFDAGLELPFVLAVVGENGSVIAIRYGGRRDALEATSLASHAPDDRITLPINAMAVGAGGAVRRFVFQDQDAEVPIDRRGTGPAN